MKEEVEGALPEGTTSCFDAQTTPHDSTVKGIPHSEITRRSFLGGSAVFSAAAFLPRSAWAADTHGDFDLAFDLSADGSELTVGIVELAAALEPGRRPRPADVVLADDKWTIHGRDFGPSYRFSLATRSGDALNTREYDLTVSGVRFGRDHPSSGAQPGRKVIFLFRLHPGANGKPRWHISAHTDFWSSSLARDPFLMGKLHDAKRILPDQIDFRNFLLGQTPLHQWISGNRVTGTLRRIFNGLAAARRTVIALRFHANGAWELGPNLDGGGDVLEVLHPQLHAVRLLLRWCAKADAARFSGPSPADAASQRLWAYVDEDSGPGVLAEAEISARPAALKFEQDGRAFALTSRSESALGAHMILRTAERTVRPGALPRRAEAATAGLWSLSVIADGVETGSLTNLNGRLRSASEIPTALATTDPEAFETVITFDAEFSTANEFAITSPVGRLTIAGILPSTSDSSPAVRAAKKGSRSQTLFGNRAGAAVRAALSARGSAVTQRAAIEWFEANVSLHQAALSLPGADYSRLDFAAGDFVLALPRENRPFSPRGSFLRLDRTPASALAGRLDLSLARLFAARSDCLASLRFRFSGLAIEMVRQRGGGAPFSVEIVNASSTCGHLANADWPADNAPAETFSLRDDDARNPEQEAAEPTARVRRQARGSVDSRPVLVVEFPPQHVMEEAKFIPSLPALPDVRINRVSPKSEWIFLKGSRANGSWLVETERMDDDTKPTFGSDAFLIDPDNSDHIFAALSLLANVSGRAALREKIRETKSVSFSNDPQRDAVKAFADFAAAFHTEAARLPRLPFRAIPLDQRVYIGPIAMDPDARLVARRVQGARLDSETQGYIVRMLDAVKMQAAEILSANPTGFRDHANNLSTALLLEGRLESVVPSYQAFRTYYRDTRVEELLDAGDYDLRSGKVEFIAPLDGNRRWADNEFLKSNERRLKEGYAKVLRSADQVTGLTEARLSAPTRLAFRVNCRDGLTAARGEVVGLDRREDELASLGRNRFAFNFDALTDWSAMELSVVRRAERVYAAGGGGRLDETGGRRVDLSSGAQLDHFGFRSGPFVLASERAADVAASLRDGPDPWQTNIVIPSRLSLSPSNEGVFLTRRPVPAMIFARDPSPVATGAEGFTTPGGRDVALLWSAWLDTEATQPNVRAIHSPDLRPEFMLGATNLRDGEVMLGARLPGSGAPAAGPFAPWMMGREETPTSNPTALKIAQGLSQDDLDEAERTRIGALLEKDETAFCEAVRAAETSGQPYPLPRLIAHLCRRLNLRSEKEFRKHLRFRSSLSANDRHQLVLLTSAFGLPTRDSGGAEEIAASSSRKEAEARYILADVMPGSGLYDPKPLEVRELVLTALGGSLRHSTDFRPPASARHISERNLYDALSIERWQHWTVLGRDVLSEIVYKGFLFPLGHGASLVKVTERTFLRDAETRLVRAYLRQRMFIRLSKPRKRFPAIGQANGGRRFPARNVEIFTDATPDIVDPYASTAAAGIEKTTLLPSGRLHIPGKPGLAFWPRIAMIDGAEVRFELGVDGVFSDLPLLFVDNVAANDDGALKEIVAYYNDIATPDDEPAQTPESTTDSIALQPIQPKTHRRSLRLGGQKLRYAPEVKSGSASFETESWTLVAEGRDSTSSGRSSEAQSPASPGQASYVFRNDRFVFSPVLQGADQPPFYPVVQIARIHLRQNKRLTGRDSGVVRASFDSHYALEGLPLPGKAAKAGVSLDKLATEKQNGMQIVLNLIDQPKQDMGALGDQSGGLFRPAGRIVALSRAKGIITNTQPIIVDPPSKAVSLANAYTQSAEISPPGAKSPAPPTGVISDLTQSAGEIYRKFFSSDAKLLGLVEIRELVALLQEGRQDTNVGVPQLVEQVSYGVGQAAEAAQDTTDVVRTNVILPLSRVVKDIRDSWLTLDRQLRAQQVGAEGIVDPIRLSDLFPALNQGLDDFDAALGTASSESDATAFAFALSGVYEAGRRFLDAVEETAANPVQRFEEGFKSRFLQLRNFASSSLLELKALWPTLNEALEEQASEQLTWLLVPQSATGEGDYAWLYVQPPRPGFAMLTDTARAQVRESLLLRASTIRAIIIEVLRELAKGADVAKIWEMHLPYGQSWLRAIFATNKTLADYLKESMLERIRSTRATILTLPDASAAAKAEALKDLHLFEIALFNQHDLFKSVFDREIAFVGDVAARFEALKAAMKLGHYADAAKRAVSLVETFTGPLDVNVDDLCKKPRLTEMLAHLGRAISLEGQELSTIRPIEGAEPYDPERDDCRVVDDALDPRFVNSGEPDPLRDRLQSVHGRLGELLAQIDSPKAKEFKAKVLADDPAVYAARKVVSGLETLVALARKARNAVAATHCDLVNDTLRLHALQYAFGVALDAAALDGLCAPTETAKAFERLPAHAESFIDVRRTLLATLGTNLDNLASQLQTLVNDEDVKIALAAGAIVGAGAKLWSEIGGDAQKAGDDLARDILALFSAASSRLAAIARRMDEETSAIAAVVAGLGEKVQPFVPVDTAAIDANRKDVTLLSAYLADLDARIAAKLASQVTITTLGEIAAEVEGRPISMLRLYRVEAASGIVTLNALADLEVRLSDVLLRAVNRVETEIASVKPEVLIHLDKVVYAALTLGSAGAPHGPIHRLYVELEKSRAEVIANAPPHLTPIVAAALSVPRREGFDDSENDRLAQDIALLATALPMDKARATPISAGTNRRFLRTFFEEWSSGNSTPPLILSQLGDIFADLIRGDFLQLIDLSQIREAIEDYLLSLIPSRIDMSYDFSTALSPEVAAATAGIFVPQTGSAFSIAMRLGISLDAGRPEVTYRSEGRIGPFNINLVGTFDAVTLKFRGAEFITENGAKPRFRVDYDDYVIGDQLKFVQALSSYFTPRDGSGFFLVPRFGPPGIEAGYSLALGTISVGTVSFFNVSVEVSAILPFSDDEAVFRASLSRRSSPFTISAAPYGGSGFFAIDASAKGIVGFEASFEYGGAGAFAFGPLNGQGRLMVGIYIRQRTLPSGKVTEINGTFFAGGSSSIWIFSFGSSLYVRLGMVDGDMSGEAVFTFSFSIGIKDFDFSVPVWKKEGEGFTSSRQAGLGHMRQFAAIGSTDYPGEEIDLRRARIEKSAEIRCPGKDWAGYLRYFDRRLEGIIEEVKF